MPTELGDGGSIMGGNLNWLYCTGNPMKYPSRPWLSHALKGVASLSLTFLVLEFFDEMDYAIGGAALPAMFDELALSYAQVGLLLGLPTLINTFVEPILMLLGDTSLRKRIILGGGLMLGVASLLISGAISFLLLLIGFVFGRIASGAFVSLSQASLMDLNAGREPHMMARWGVAGTLGNLIGPLILAGAFALGAGWRPVYAGLAVCYLVLTVIVWIQPFPVRAAPVESRDEGILARGRQLMRNFWETARSPGLIRWILLMQFADLMLDIFISYMPLYFVEIVGLSNSQVSLLLSA